MVNVVLLGPPGAGKGTQAPIVAEVVGGGFFSTGELLRQAVREGTPHGVLARAYMDRGELVPDDVVLDLVMKHLAEHPGAAFVLDGFPRNLNQARALDEALAASGQQVDHAISIDVPRPVLLDRLTGRSTEPPGGAPARGRADDRPETVERRLDVFERETAPVREYYRQRNVLSEIDGARPVAAVTSQILQALGREPTTPDQ